jgi:hypothetical protein
MPIAEENNFSPQSRRFEMYTIEKTNLEVIVSGPNGYEKRLPNDAVDIVFRIDAEEIWHGSLRPYAIKVSSMTEAEAVACALGIQAFPGP